MTPCLTDRDNRNDIVDRKDMTQIRPTSGRAQRWMTTRARKRRLHLEGADIPPPLADDHWRQFT